MLKQEYPEQIFKILDLNWNQNEHTSTGSTVTTSALKAIYERLKQLEDCGGLSIAKGIEKFKKS